MQLRRILSIFLALILTLGLLFPGALRAEAAVSSSEVIDGYCGDNVRYTLDIIDGTEAHLTISGTGKMTDFSGDVPVPWSNYMKQITTVKIQEGVTSIGQSAFCLCTNLTSVTIPGSVTSIGEWAFDGCNSLPGVIIPEGVTSIGRWAFDYCSAMTAVAIGKSVVSIGDAAFNHCYALQRVYYGGWSTDWDKIDIDLNNKYLKEANLYYNQATSGTCGDNVHWKLSGNFDLTISGTGDMADYTGFESPWCRFRDDITTVEIENGVTSIGYCVFRYHTALTHITIPASVTRISEYAFVHSAIPKEVYYIGSAENWAKIQIGKGNTSLTNATIRYAVNTTLTASGTCGENLTWKLASGKLTISGTGEMTDYAFQNDAPWFDDLRIIQSVEIENGVTSIGGHAFRSCISMTAISIPNSVTSIGEYAFCNCQKLKNITIPDSVTSIGECVFYMCPSLTGVTIPDSITHIGYSAFYDCTGLTSITIPDSVTTIGAHAFDSCTSLTSVTIPKSVTSMDIYAFWGCTGLTSVTILGSTISKGAFCFCADLTSVTISDNVTSIGEGAFDECTSLTSITIPDSVTSIGDEAFFMCSSLTEIIIPDSVTSIGEYAFIGCTSMTRVSLGKKVTTIAKGTFNGCSSLTSITIPSSVTSIDICAFDDCTSLTDVYYGGSQADWVKITIDEYNEPLTNATIHYNYAPVSISTQPKSQSVKVDATAKFVVKATGSELKYQWQYRTSESGSWKDSGAASATTASFSVKGTTARNGYQYRCKITDAAGNTVYSDAATLTVTGVTITTQPKTQNVKADATAKFTVKATGSGLKYQWQYRTSSSGSWKNSGATSATTATFSVKGTTARNGYQYRCKVTDSSGNSVYTNTVTLYVLGITTQPKTTTVANNATAKFTVKATGNGLKYQWQYRTSSSGSWKNSGAASATTATFSVKGTTARNGYQYRCKITDAAGNTIYSSTVTLKVSAASITTQPKSVTVANGKTAKFTVKTSGSGLKFQWQYRTSSSGSWKNSGASSATSKTFSVKGTYERDGYQYRCRITDKNGNVIYTNTVTLTVN